MKTAPLAIFLLILLSVNALYLGGPVPAMLFTWALMLANRRYAVYGLIAVASLQDTPNIWYLSQYVLFTGAALIALSPLVVSTADSGASRQWYRTASVYRFFVFCAAFLSVYAFFVTMTNDALFDTVQLLGPPYWVIAPFMLLMLIAALGSVKLIGFDPQGTERLWTTALVLICYGSVITLLQIFFGQEWCRSPQGLMETTYAGADTLRATVLGYPRLNGTFTSPDALANEMSLMMVILVVAQKKLKVTGREILTFFLVGLSFSLATFAKSNLVFVALGTWAMLWDVSKSRMAVFSGILLLMLWFITTTDIWHDLLLSFRVLSLAESNRPVMWRAVIDHLHLAQWIFGGGLSFWRDFYVQAIGYPAIEPHTYLLSIPGTFGVLGTIFYVALLALLITTRVKTRSVRAKIAIDFVIIYIFVREAVTDQTVLGNTVFTYWIWLTLGVALLAANAARKKGRVPLQLSSPGMATNAI